MRNLRVLTAGLLGAALTLAVMAIPASANGDAKLVIGHGVPKLTVDICVNDGSGQVEVKSNFKYGQHFKATLPAGVYKFITRVAAPGNCKGAAVIRETFDLGVGADLSVIATVTRGAPVYTVFDNHVLEVGTAGYEGFLSLKHAARIGAADLWVDILARFDEASGEPSVTMLKKGQAVDIRFLTLNGTSVNGGTGPDVKVSIAKTGEDAILKTVVYEESAILARTPYWEVRPGFVNHVVAVGAKKNLRFLRYRTELGYID